MAKSEPNDKNLKLCLNENQPIFPQQPSPTSLLTLPEKLRVRILKMLGWKDRRNVQFVCRLLRNEIRMRVGIQCRVSDTVKNGLVFMRDVIVESILVGKFNKSTLTPAQIIVNELVFEEPISIPQLDGFLGHCFRVSKVLIAAPPLGIENQIPTQYSSSASISPYLPQNPNILVAPRQNIDILRNLDTIFKLPPLLERLSELSIVIPSSRAFINIQKLLSLINAPQLDKLSIRVGSNSDPSDSVSIHLRILNHVLKYSSLSHLLISTHPTKGNLTKEEGNHSKSGMIDIGNKLQFKRLILTESSCTIFTMWNLILSRQKNLHVLQILQVMSLKLLHPVVQRNYKNLRKIGIHLKPIVKENQTVPLSLGIFRKCSSLKELMIDFSVIDQSQPPQEPTSPNVCLFHELPPSLKVLSLRSCVFLTVDLLQLPKSCQKLKSIGLIGLPQESTKYYSGFGPNLRAIRDFLNSHSLNELLLTGVRISEKDKANFEHIKKKLGSVPKLNGIYVGSRRKERNRWVVGANGSCLFKFAHSWGNETFKK